MQVEVRLGLTAVWVVFHRGLLLPLVCAAGRFLGWVRPISLNILHWKSLSLLIQTAWKQSKSRASVTSLLQKNSPEPWCKMSPTEGEIQLLTATILTSKLLSLPVCVTGMEVSALQEMGMYCSAHCLLVHARIAFSWGNDVKKNRKKCTKKPNTKPWRLCIFKKLLLWKEKYLLLKTITCNFTLILIVLSAQNKGQLWMQNCKTLARYLEIFSIT